MPELLGRSEIGLRSAEVKTNELSAVHSPQSAVRSPQSKERKLTNMENTFGGQIDVHRYIYRS